MSFKAHWTSEMFNISYNRCGREDEAAWSLLVQNGDCCRSDLPEHRLHWVVRAKDQWEGLVPLPVFIGQNLHFE